MKLVEILARELEVWPEFRTRFGQLSNGELIADGIACTLRATLAEDWEAACITRPQWQAERDKMSKMKALIEARDNPPSTEPTYEQQLWDSVYLKAFNEVHALYPTITAADVAYSAAGYADAFMAERAKRVGK